MIKSTWQTLLYIVIYMWKYDEKDHTPREKWSCRMTRAAYILLRFAEMVISSNSRLFNAAVFGGSTHQTTSARAHIDGKTDPELTGSSHGMRRTTANVRGKMRLTQCEKPWTVRARHLANRGRHD